MPRQTRMATPKAPRMEPTAMKTVPSGRVEWFMKGALCVGGMVGAGYSGTLVSTVLESEGRPGSLPIEVELLLRPGSGGVVVGVVDVEGDEVEDDGFSSSFELVDSVVGGGCWRGVVVVRVCWGVVVVGGAARVLVVVWAGGLFLVVAVVRVLSSFWATTLRAKKVARSRARFSESGDDDPMVPGLGVVCVVCGG